MGLGIPSISNIPDVLQPSVTDVQNRLDGSTAFQNLFNEDEQFAKLFFQVIPV